MYMYLSVINVHDCIFGLSLLLVPRVFLLIFLVSLTHEKLTFPISNSTNIDDLHQNKLKCTQYLDKETLFKKKSYISS